MTDKVQKIREEVEKRYEYWKEKESNSHSIESEIRMSECQHLLLMVDSLQEEPISEQNLSNVERIGKDWKEEPVSEDFKKFEVQYLEKEEDEIFSVYDRHAGLVDGAQWQKEQFEKNRLAACDRQTEEEAEMERDFCMGIIENEHRQPTFDDAIKYGMRLQKKQMMAKAIDGVVTFDYYGNYVDDDKTYGCIAHDSFCLEDFGLKDMDKVKMILIKEG